MWTFFFVLVLFQENQVILSQYGCEHPCQSSETCEVSHFKDTCYYRFWYSGRTWEQTLQHCKSENLTMVKLPSDIVRDESRYKKMAEAIANSSVWLGGRARNLGRWEFVNGDSFMTDYMKFSLKSKNRTGFHECGILPGKTLNIVIDSETCNSTYPYICRLDGKISKIHIGQDRENWYDARSSCIKLGGDLLYLNNGEKFDDLLKIEEWSSLKHDKYFIGLRNEIWEWADGKEMSHFSWNEGTPNGNNENCLMMYRNGKWIDKSCTKGKAIAFCQKIPKMIRSSTVAMTPTTRDHHNMPFTGEWTMRPTGPQTTTTTTKTTPTTPPANTAPNPMPHDIHQSTAVNASDPECNHWCLSEGSCNVRELNGVCCYYFNETLQSWDETREFCKSHNLAMLKLPEEVKKNVNEMKTLIEPLRISSTTAWLGGRARDLGKWMFLNGVPLNKADLQLSSKFLDEKYHHMCGLLTLSNVSKFEVGIEACYRHHPSICQLDATSNQNTPLGSESWYKARSICIAKGGDLFYSKDFKALKRWGQNLTTFFIGLRHEAWEWEDGEEIMHFNWNTNQPSGSDEKCLMLDSDGKWSDTHCSATTKVALCQGGIGENHGTTWGSSSMLMLWAFVGLANFLVKAIYIYVRISQRQVQSLHMRIHDRVRNINSSNRTSATIEQARNAAHDPHEPPEAIVEEIEPDCD